MTSPQARLDGTRRVVRCLTCGAELGRIWDNGVGERHFLFPNSMGLTEAGVWATTRRGRRAGDHGHDPYRRRLPVAGSLTPRSNPFPSIALEPTGYPLRVRCPQCRQLQGMEAAAIDVLVPEPEDPPQAFLTWPLSEPFERIGEPGEG